MSAPHLRLLPHQPADRPRVLIYRDHLLGLTERFILDQGEALPRFEAFYAGARHVDGPPVPSERQLLISDGTHLGRLRELWFKLSQHPPRRLLQALEQINPSLIHAHFGPDGILVLPLSRQLGLPLVVTFHGYEVTMLPEAVGRFDFLHRNYLHKRKELQRQGTLFIAVSDFIRRRMIEQGFPAERTIVHYIGVDTDLFRPPERPADDELVLYAGRLSSEKGPDYFVRAMSIVQAERPSARAVLVGDGSMRSGLEQLARDCNARIEFMGRVPHASVRDWLHRTTLLCAPSVTVPSGQAEAFGLALIEAQACAVPVAGFATGGVPEAVEHGQTGLLAPDGDWRAMARNILLLLRDRDLYVRMKEAARERTVRLFDLRNQTALLDRLYTDLLSDLRHTA